VKNWKTQGAESGKFDGYLNCLFLKLE